MNPPKFRFDQDELAKLPIVTEKDGKVVPPSEDATFETLYPKLASHHDVKDQGYPHLQDEEAMTIFWQGIEELKKEAETDFVDQGFLIQCFQRVVNQHPHYWPNRINLAYAFKLNGRRSYAEAEQHLLETIAGIQAMLSGKLPCDSEPTVVPVTEEKLRLFLARAYYNLAEVIQVSDQTEARIERTLEALDHAIAATDPRWTDHLTLCYMVKTAFLVEAGHIKEAKIWWCEAQNTNEQEWKAKLEHFRRAYPALRTIEPPTTSIQEENTMQRTNNKISVAVTLIFAFLWMVGFAPSGHAQTLPSLNDAKTAVANQGLEDCAGWNLDAVTTKFVSGQEPFPSSYLYLWSPSLSAQETWGFGGYNSFAKGCLVQPYVDGDSYLSCYKPEGQNFLWTGDIQDKCPLFPMDKAWTTGGECREYSAIENNQYNVLHTFRLGRTWKDRPTRGLLVGHSVVGSRQRDFRNLSAAADVKL